MQLLQVLDKNLVASFPREVALQFKVLPLAENAGELLLAAAQQPLAGIEDELRFVLNRQVRFRVYSEAELDLALQEFYKRESGAEQTADGFQLSGSGSFTSAEFRSGGDEPSTINVVNALISSAIHERASDIHLEPVESGLNVRVRIDGALQARQQFPSESKDAILSRIKIMADLDIAERRRPQDGRIRMTNESKKIDIRVSTLPTAFGEKIVMRILDKESQNLDLRRIGLSSNELQIYEQAVASPHGMILVTGPTGSGKTTTLYATLNHLNNEQVNIVTIEDPIEYDLPGINQSQMRGDIGYSFSSALKTFLRQDPDIIMVGEIRDQETAEIAVRAALTGHLVLSTLHTNDAPGAITRLIDIGVEPFLVASCVRLVVAQRLVRRLCPICKKEASASVQASHAGHSDSDIKNSYSPVGCSKCFATGFSGRLPLFEVMSMTPKLAQAMIEGCSAFSLKELALENGMKTLRTCGLEKLALGETTVEEILRETEG